MPRKEIREITSELRSWLPNYSQGPHDYPTLLFRLLAGIPGGDDLEDLGYEPLSRLGWRELHQLERVLVAIESQRDVEDLVKGLLEDDEE